MRRIGLVVGLLMGMFAATVAAAQDVWVQIEALPTLAEGEERARAYGGVFPDVSGFELTSGWYAIVLGPYAASEAQDRLDLLRREGMIPQDSYIPDSGRFIRRFWPAGGVQPTPAPVAPEAQAEAPVVVEPLPDESPQEARRSEAELSEADRQALQTALQWEGFYAGKIDGAIGAGTRASMAAWQASRGFPETGILTTAQRAQLIEDYSTDVAAIGLTTITEDEAGIEIAMPSKLVTFKGYQPPFVEYDSADGSGFQVLLISQQGDESTLFGLYDIMQTLEIVPLEGERQRQRTSFVLTGKNDRVQSYTQAELAGGFIKGFTLVWRPEDGARATKVLEAMKASFRAVGDRALDESIGEPLGVGKEALLAGLEVRRPLRAQSGFYLDPAGSVLTTAGAVEGCGRITLDGQTAATIKASDAKLGLAVLAPEVPLAPRAVASFRTGATRIGAEVAVAGYAYGESLSAPVVTFGTFEAPTGLTGEAGVNRLSIRSLPGDAGGPVLDTTGSVVGMLLSPPVGGDQVLPDDVAFALPAGSIAEALTLAGLPPSPSTATGAIAAEDIAALGRDMAVLVSCWE